MLADEEGRTVCSSLDTRHSLYTSEYVDASDKAQYSPQASLNFAIEWMQTFGDVSSGPRPRSGCENRSIASARSMWGCCHLTRVD